MIGAIPFQLPADKVLESGKVAHQMRAFPLNVMVGADLQIPGVAYKSELEEPPEIVPGKHLSSSDHLGVPGKLDPEPVTGEAADSAANRLQPPGGIAPHQGIQRGAYARSPGLGDMHEKETVFVGYKHSGAPANNLSQSRLAVHTPFLPGHPGTTKHEDVARRRRVAAEARVSSRVSHDGIRDTFSDIPGITSVEAGNGVDDDDWRESIPPQAVPTRPRCIMKPSEALHPSSLALNSQ